MNLKNQQPQENELKLSDLENKVFTSIEYDKLLDAIWNLEQLLEGKNPYDFTNDEWLVANAISAIEKVLYSAKKPEPVVKSDLDSELDPLPF